MCDARGILERLFRVACYASGVFVLAVVGGFLAYLLAEGVGSLGAGLFFGEVAPLDAMLGRAPVWDGIYPALIGSLSVVTLANLLALPLGMACGIFLAECLHGWPKRLLGFGMDVLASLPSILLGLFGFALILFLRATFLPHANTSLLLAAVCLACLVLPYVVATTRNSLESLPAELRLIGPALGFSRWQNIRHVLLPACRHGLLSGTILAIGRTAEDTAVIMLTGVVASAGLPAGLGEHFEALPFFIYYTTAESRGPADIERAFGAALVLILICTLLFALARLVARQMTPPGQGNP